MRIDPPVSVPMAARHIPVATATAELPLDPPGIASSRHGLRVTPYVGLAFVTPKANSWRLCLPTTIAPVRRNRATVEALKHSGVEELDIPAFLRKQAD